MLCIANHGTDTIHGCIGGHTQIIFSPLCGCESVEAGQARCVCVCISKAHVAFRFDSSERIGCVLPMFKCSGESLRAAVQPQPCLWNAIKHLKAQSFLSILFHHARICSSIFSLASFFITCGRPPRLWE